MAVIETIPYAKSAGMRATEAACRALSIKRLANGDAEDLGRMMQRFAKRQDVEIPLHELSRTCDVRVEEFGGRPCVIARRRGGTPTRAVLFLFGGSFFLPPDRAAWKGVAEYACDADAEVWFPLYPLAPRHSLREMLESLMAVYEAMLGRWDAGHVLFMGNSSGAGNCLYLCLRILHEQLPLALPAHLILLSPPLCMPPRETQLALMRKLEPTDCMLPVNLCLYGKDVLLRDEDGLDWLADTLANDWSGMPSMDAFFGTDEIFAAFAGDMATHADECGVELSIHLGEGMMHCWPQRYWTSEGKDGRARIKRLICER